MTTIALSASLAAHHHRSATELRAAYTSVEKALRDVRAGRKRIDRLAETLAYQHGRALSEREDVRRGLLWLARGLRGAEGAEDFETARDFRLDLAAWRDRVHPIRNRWEYPGEIRCIATSPEGRRVATAGPAGTVRLWDANTGAAIGEPIRHGASLRTDAFSPDGRVLASGGDDRLAHLCDAGSGRELAPAMVHGESVSCIAFSPDGLVLATASYDTSVLLWDARMRRPFGSPIFQGARVFPRLRPQRQVGGDVQLGPHGEDLGRRRRGADRRTALARRLIPIPMDD